MRKYFISAIVIMCFALSAKTVYVNDNASGNNDGTSWGNAFNDLLSALYAVNYGDQIWVAEGTYKPSSDYGTGPGSRYYHFRLIDGVQIYGGFEGFENSIFERDIALNETIISGDIGTVGDPTDNCYNLFYHPDFGYQYYWDAVLDGFTLRDAYANGFSPYDQGGAIYNFRANITVRNCKFTANRAYSGGAVYNNWDSDSRFINCTFTGNTATGYGGAAVNSNSTAEFANCLFYLNTALYGGAVYDASDSRFVNCTVAKNTSSFGGGFYTYYASTVINNSIIWGNTASTSGHQFYNNNNSNITLNYSSYTSGAAHVFNNNSSFTAANNCLVTDPLFVDQAGNNFRLQEASTCRDSGNNTYNSETLDIDDYARIQNVTIDRGPYEFIVLNIPGITISEHVSGVELIWDAVPYAYSYKIYAALTPYGSYNLLTATDNNRYVYSVSDNMKYFYITASTEQLK